MSCNGCRVLRKGCNEKCILRQSLQGIQSSEAQSNATIFVAKFFGRAGLMSFLSGVPDSQRPALFRSLLFEACGRTINPVTGAVGMLMTGNWHVCQSAVRTILRGGVLHPIPKSSFDPKGSLDLNFSHNATINGQDLRADLDLCLTQQHQSFPGRMTAGGRVNRRAETPPSLDSDESETMTFESNNNNNNYYDNTRRGSGDTKILRLFF